MIGRLTFTFLLTALLNALAGSSIAQDNPFDLITGELEYWVEVPDGLDLRLESAELFIGLETENGETLSHTTNLDFIRRIENSNLRSFSIPTEDLLQINALRDQFEIWKQDDIHGKFNLEMNIGICRYGPLPEDSAVFIFSVNFPETPGKLIQFGGLDYTAPELAEIYNENDVTICAHKI